MPTMTATPIYVQSPKSWTATATAACSTYNDSTNKVQLVPAGSNATAISRITAVPRGTVTATQLQLFLFDGTNYKFLTSELMAAYTMAQTTKCSPTPFLAPDSTSFSLTNPLYIPPGWSLYCAIGVALAAGIDFTANGGDY